MGIIIRFFIASLINVFFVFVAIYAGTAMALHNVCCVIPYILTIIFIQSIIVYYLTWRAKQ